MHAYPRRYVCEWEWETERLFFGDARDAGSLAAGSRQDRRQARHRGVTPKSGKRPVGGWRRKGAKSAGNAQPRSLLANSQPFFRCTPPSRRGSGERAHCARPSPLRGQPPPHRSASKAWEHDSCPISVVVVFVRLAFIGGSGLPCPSWRDVSRGLGRGVVVELGVRPRRAARKSLAISHHEVDVLQGVGHHGWSRRFRTLLHCPIDLRHSRFVREAFRCRERPPDRRRS